MIEKNEFIAKLKCGRRWVPESNTNNNNSRARDIVYTFFYPLLLILNAK